MKSIGTAGGNLCLLALEHKRKLKIIKASEKGKKTNGKCLMWFEWANQQNKSSL